MLPMFTENFGNASSKDHRFGWAASQAVGQSRLELLQWIGARSPDEIVFTSGATESNNLALRGIAEGHEDCHIVTSAIEHPCVLQTCQALQARGVDISVVGVDSQGLVDPEEVRGAMRGNTRLVSIMAVNNEVGTIQPIREIAAIAHRGGALFHCDAAQGAGRIPLDVQLDGIDLLSLSAHKVYGPQGVGALYIRQCAETSRLRPQMTGGAQERGRRSGTLNLPGIVGFGEAARICREEGELESARQARLRDSLLRTLNLAIPDVHVFGSLRARVGCNLSLSLGGIPGDALLAAASGLALSGGAACSSGKASGSHVLRAMGYSQREANSAIRLCIGRMTSAEDIEIAARELIGAARALESFARTHSVLGFGANTSGCKAAAMPREAK